MEFKKLTYLMLCTRDSLKGSLGSVSTHASYRFFSDIATNLQDYPLVRHGVRRVDVYVEVGYFVPLRDDAERRPRRLWKIISWRVQIFAQFSGGFELMVAGNQCDLRQRLPTKGVGPHCSQCRHQQYHCDISSAGLQRTQYRKNNKSIRK